LGELGLGDIADRGVDYASLPYFAPAASLPATASSVALGAHHTCASSADHRLMCWGDNSFGQLGLGDVANRGSTLERMGLALPFVDLGYAGP
jgi:alpha-tubulin suppressor-like RCC1 family protein